MKRSKNVLLLTLAVITLGFCWKSSSFLYVEPPVSDSQPDTNHQFTPWKQGLLDIHHLYVGSSVSSFIILPDGTTILVDAGQVHLDNQRKWWKELGLLHLKALEPVPNATKSPTEWILEYLEEFWPHGNQKNKAQLLDYVLVTHFHSDHFGEPTGTVGELSGFPAIAKKLKIGTLIDRGYPHYDFPRDLRSAGDANIDNYLQFIDNITTDVGEGIHLEQFQVGSKQQIRLLHNDNNDNYDFSILVIKNNDQVLVDGGARVAGINGTWLDGKQGKWNENVMSAAFVLRYGDFKYYEGGDQEVVRDDKNAVVLLDTIGPTARAAGKVHVASLNHHGHGVTSEFVRVMDPSIVIQQGWCSDQPKKESVELLSASRTNTGQQRQIFATHVFPDKLEELGPTLAGMFSSTSGHVVVRVHPPSSSSSPDQHYEVFVLDQYRKLKSHHGPYPVHAGKTKR